MKQFFRQFAGVRIASVQALAAVFASAALLSGCSTSGRRFQVSQSQLNWMEVSYKPAKNGAPFCRISMLGTGSITMRMGTSPRIADSFSYDTRNANWNDVEQIRADIPQEEMQDVFQMFIDNGITDSPRSDKHAGEIPGKAIVMIGARIDREKIRRRTDDEKIVGMVERLIQWLVDQEEAR